MSSPVRPKTDRQSHKAASKNKPQHPESQEQLPAPERQPGTQPPGVAPKSIPEKEFDPNYTRREEIELPKHEDDQKGYAEVPREDLIPEFDEGAKDSGSSAETSGDPAQAFAEQ